MPKLIEDETLFPRSEYYSRFEGTTAFAMDDAEYWDTYHRSHAARSTKLVKGIAYLNPKVIADLDFLKKEKLDAGLHAHQGVYKNPIGSPIYRAKRKDFKSHAEPAPVSSDFIYDQLIEYKLKMCAVVCETFITQFSGGDEVRKRVASKAVYFDNTYSCVMVDFAELGLIPEYFKKNVGHPFQSLLMAYLIGIVNYLAYGSGIHIELVKRASFGHNLPSVSSTDQTFRINVGLIPQAYAKLIGQSLAYLVRAIDTIKKNTVPAVLPAKMIEAISKYNYEKLTNAITKKPLYKKIKPSGKSFDQLYAEFQQINARNGGKKGYAIFKPVDLTGSIWALLSKNSNSKGGSILSDLFRNPAGPELLSNFVLDQLLAEGDVDQRPLVQMLDFLEYGEVVTTGSTVSRIARYEKRKWAEPGVDNLVAADPAFKAVLGSLYKALGKAEAPPSITGLYADLEQLHVEFAAHARSSEAEADDGAGSDSEHEGILEPSGGVAGKQLERFFQKKLIVNTGMEAVAIAAFEARLYLKNNGYKSYFEDSQVMYFETEKALATLKPIEGLSLNKVRSEAAAILYFDLNHCINDGKKTASLSDKLKEIKPRVVILDYTGATSKQVYSALAECRASKVELILTVSSGLKNEQGGADTNPYGTIRIFTSTPQELDKIYTEIKSLLPEGAKVPGQSHKYRRLCKSSGLVLRAGTIMPSKDVKPLATSSEWSELADRYFMEENYVEARKACLQSLALDNENAQAHYCMGRLYHRGLGVEINKNYAYEHFAMAAYLKHVEADSQLKAEFPCKNADEWFGVGEKQFNKTNYNMARYCFLQALAIDANHVYSLFGLGHIYQHAHSISDINTAISYYKRAADKGYKYAETELKKLQPVKKPKAALVFATATNIDKSKPAASLTQ